MVISNALEEKCPSRKLFSEKLLSYRTWHREMATFLDFFHCHRLSGACLGVPGAPWTTASLEGEGMVMGRMDRSSLGSKGSQTSPMSQATSWGRARALLMP